MKMQTQALATAPARHPAAIAPTFVCLCLLLCGAWGAAAARYSSLEASIGLLPHTTQGMHGRDPRPTHSGYLPVAHDGSALFYTYWEARAPRTDNAPIILWLQGGPGCASTFGGFYELGPYLVTEDLQLIENPGSWARSHGLLLIDQPLGTGFSQPARNESIPRDEMGMAAHLYRALQHFFTLHRAELGARPLIITGESYGGKYVPSIAHYILQAKDMHESKSSSNSGSGSSSGSGSGSLPMGSGVSALLDRSGGRLKVWRRLSDDTPPPVFTLAGIAIGNGLTDPRSQVPVMAATAFHHGLLTPALKVRVEGMARDVVALIDEERWGEAHTERERLRAFITNVSGLATMFDTRRDEEYDARASVDRLLNLPEVKAALRVHAEVNYTSCSEVVGEIMAADTMQSVKHLLPDVLERVAVLLYQGQFDILDGVASSIAWIDSLEWQLQQQLAQDPGMLWSHAGRAAGWKRQAGNLQHAVVYRAGHMVPHDQPGASQALIEDWISGFVEV